MTVGNRSAAVRGEFGIRLERHVMTRRRLANDLLEDLAAIAAHVDGVSGRPQDSMDDRGRQLVVAKIAPVDSSGSGEAVKQGAGMADHSADFALTRSPS